MTCAGCDRSKDAAIKTLERLGYTYHGGEEWKPPHWIKLEKIDDDYHAYMCSVCGYQVASCSDMSDSDHCYKCGVKMQTD